MIQNVTQKKTALRSFEDYVGLFLQEEDFRRRWAEFLKRNFSLQISTVSLKFGGIRIARFLPKRWSTTYESKKAGLFFFFFLPPSQNEPWVQCKSCSWKQNAFFCPPFSGFPTYKWSFGKFQWHLPMLSWYSAVQTWKMMKHHTKLVQQWKQHLPSLKLTANASENRPNSKMKQSYSNHPFSGSFGEGKSPNTIKNTTWRTLLVAC